MWFISIRKFQMFKINYKKTMLSVIRLVNLNYKDKNKNK